MPYPPATVNVNAADPSVHPDPINVKRIDLDEGVIWTIPNKTHAFTYVTFDQYADNFHSIVIAENDAGQSTLQIDDTIENLGEIKYTLYYIEKSHPMDVLIIDPKIKNQ